MFQNQLLCLIFLKNQHQTSPFITILECNSKSHLSYQCFFHIKSNISETCASIARRKRTHQYEKKEKIFEKKDSFVHQQNYF